MNEYKTHTCNEISLEDVGKKVRIAGWVQTIRDLGGLVFLDIRDMYGITQVVTSGEAKDVDFASHIPIESTVTVYGIVKKRDEETINPKLKTGLVEIKIEEIKVLGKRTKNLPFEINKNQEIREDLRLKYRYLDLRNETLQNNLKLRAQVLQFLRNQMQEQGFLEVQTPILTSSSPEGARDYLVPSRLNPGEFYALPQAPQQFKQLLMLSGFNKYYQVAPCFRDEDSRKDRTLEFYQLDMEMSYVTEDDVLEVGEEIFYDVFSKFSNKEVSPRPFRRIAYKEAMDSYGSDKPDLRNPLIIKDASKVLEHTSFGPFKGSIIKVIVVDDIGTKPNSWFNEIVDYASSIGMPGIGYITLMSDGSLKGPIDKFLSEEERENLIKEFNMKENSVMFFIANKRLNVARKFAGLIRDELGRKLELIDPNKLELCIVNDFPMFEYDDKTKKYEFCHNPFSLPHNGIKEYEKENVDDILAYQYDFVCNGNEMASGAIRNTDLDSLVKGFEVVGYTKEDVEKRFNSLFTAFKYGVPPHGGMAPGIDRILMLINDEPNLREVQAFPASASGADNMMGSPSVLDDEQLEELGIKIDIED